MRAVQIRAQSRLFQRDLAQVTWDRDSPLVQKGWVTPQQGDTDRLNLQSRVAAVAVAEANVAAQENLLKELRQNRDYALIVAPFDGVITQRNVDVGSLVQGNAASGTFMFEIMQQGIIRVWVYVPQDSAFGVAPGIDAVIRVPELPDREFSGKVTRISVATGHKQTCQSLQSAARQWADAKRPGCRTIP